MSALSKLSVGQDAGTSRPATAQQTRTATRSKQQQQLEQQSHPLLQSLGFQIPQGPCLPAQWTAAVQGSLLSTDASKREQQRPNSALCRPATAYRATASAVQQPSARQSAHRQQQQLSSTLSEVLAEVLAAPQPATKASTPAQSSRPVMPHATKPYKSLPALSTILQHNNPASSSRPTTAAGRLSTSSNGHSTCASRSQAHIHAHTSSRAGWAGARPGTASNAYMHGLRCSRLQQAAPSTAGSLRPGSAAAAKILRAIDKACVATSRPGGAHTAVRKHSEPGSLECGNSRLHRAQQQQQLQEEGSEAQAAQRSNLQAASALSSCGDTTLAQDSNSISPATTHAACIAATAAAAADSRPSTAALRSVLATAGAPDDGVEARLAAIRAKNSTFDHSADLDIVYEEDNDDVTDALAEVLAEECHEGCSSKDLGAVLAAACALGGVVGGSVCGGDAGAAAGGQQATAMVLSLDDWTACTPEVLEMELELLDVEQLTELKHLLLDG